MTPAIKFAAPSAFVPYDRNARSHSEEQIAQLMRSIETFGFTNPILVTSGLKIVAGHGRAEAAKRLGLEKVPYIVVGKGWSSEQIRAYVLADNQLALNSSWDLDLLAGELEDLKLEAFNLDLLGFSEVDLSRYLPPEDTTETDPDGEWKGMPEFEQDDKGAFRTLPVHFKDQAAVDAFAKLVGQKITDKTRFLWFPQIEIERYADKRYAAED